MDIIRQTRKNAGTLRGVALAAKKKGPFFPDVIRRGFGHEEKKRVFL